MTVPFLNLKPIHDPLYPEFIEAIGSVLKQNNFILGEGVQQFEKAYAQFNKTQYALGVGNGLDALKIALKTIGVGADDEVIIPSNTFIATALAVSELGAKPILCEPDMHTYNITASNIEKHITRKTKAIIPVHLYGQSCETTTILKLAEAHKLYVVEDNAQAQGAMYNGAITGSVGHINATSFYPGKNLGALGDAGAITTNSEELFHAAAKLRNYGSDTKYIHELKGYNSRLDEMQAVLLNIKLKYLDEYNKARNAIADAYTSKLKSINNVILPQVAEGATHVYHLYVIRVEERDKLRNYLLEKGITTLIHYPVPIHKQKSYLELNDNSNAFPIAETISNTALSLPVYPGLTTNEIDYICSCIASFYEA